ncbi:hypothetical protein [Ruminococcus sp.]|uniref:hypothetical protein n=1 Tax=Ruminococcus sp. TaxID=41978 RepID=UPI00388DDC95
MKKIISIALVLVMVFALTAVATSAKESPTGEKYYSISTDAEGAGTASADKNKIAKDATGDDANVTLTATGNGGIFTKWIISGNYDIVSGDLNSAVIVIKPQSDVHATAFFTSDGKDHGDIVNNNNTTSPKTADATPYVATIVLLAMFGAMFAVKKIKE